MTINVNVMRQSLVQDPCYSCAKLHYDMKTTVASNFRVGHGIGSREKWKQHSEEKLKRKS